MKRDSPSVNDAVPLAARLRALRVVPLVPLRALLLGPSACAFMCRACVSRRQTIQVLPTFGAALRQRTTELSSFSEAVMIFMVFLEVLEMSSEVAGPGPTHGRSNLAGLTWDLLLVPSRPMPDACYPLVLFVVCGGGFLQGRRLGGPRAVLAVPSVVPVLVQHLQDLSLYRQVERCDS